MAVRGLTLVPVGVGAAYARPGEAQSAYLIEAPGAAVLLDLGAGALNRLQRRARPESLDAVVISHLHPDHCADLFALRVYMAWGPGRGRRLRLLGPRGLRAALAGFAGEDGWDDAFAFEELTGEGGVVGLAGGLALRYAQVPHLAPTFALRVDGDGHAVCYSADCSENDALARLAEGADLLVAECSFGADPVPPGVPHLGGREAGRIAARAGVGRLLLTHCYPELDRDAALAAARREFDGDVDWARQDEAVPA